VFIVTRDGGCLRPIVDGTEIVMPLSLVATADQERWDGPSGILEGLFGGVV
jgi:hypothetical protein